MHETTKRLYESAAEKGIYLPSDVARAMGISQQTLTNWEARGVSKDGFLKAQIAFEKNANWIEEGVKTKLAIDNLTPRQIEIAQLFSNLNDIEQRIFLAQINGLIESKGKKDITR